MKHLKRKQLNLKTDKHQLKQKKGLRNAEYGPQWYRCLVISAYHSDDIIEGRY